MRTDEFDFELPEELIAQQAVEPRDASRLLVVPPSGPFAHRHFRDLPEFLRPRDALVLNDTRVVAARLRGNFAEGGAVEVLLLRNRDDGAWETMVRPGRRFHAGRQLTLAGLACQVEAAPVDGIARLRFETGIDPTSAGTLPLPPYIHEQPSDPERYQTVYARAPGSAAAPTAGLHFTPELLAELEAAGVAVVYLTLHVGPGTFRPVSVDDPREHPMHEEWFNLDDCAAERLNDVRTAGGRVVAVGTTVVRTLEQIAQTHDGRFSPSSGWTRLLILPGYTFRAIDAMVTNFHLPRSTLLMLVSAFAGRERILAAYDEAIRERYRFFSFGDAMLLEGSGRL